MIDSKHIITFISHPWNQRIIARGVFSGGRSCFVRTIRRWQSGRDEVNYSYSHRARTWRTLTQVTIGCVCVVWGHNNDATDFFTVFADSYASVSKHNQLFNDWPQFRTNNRRAPLFHVTYYGEWHYCQILIKTGGNGGSRTHNLPELDRSRYRLTPLTKRPPGSNSMVRWFGGTRIKWLLLKACQL